MKIVLRQDSRDSHAYMHFGQATVAELLDEFNFDSILVDEIQPPGDVKCTCYTVCNIAEDQDKTYYDINDLWGRIAGTPTGADPRLSLGEAVKNGLKRLDNGQVVKNWSSYWRADTGIHDAFDNVRSAMQMVKCPVGVGTYWYLNWPSGETLPIGVGPTSGHMYAIEGVKKINDEPHFIIEPWIGRKLYMSRAVFNAAMSLRGMSAWVLSTADRDAKRDKTAWETLKDLCINAIILMKRLLVLRQQPIVNQPEINPQLIENHHEEVKEEAKLKRDLINEFCLAIQSREGYNAPGELKEYPNGTPAWINKNPGNIKKKGGGFLKFKSYEEGFAYLKDYVTRACTGRHDAYKPTFTILQFFQTYSPKGDNNDPISYANEVATKLKIYPSMQIKDLL